MKITIFSDNVAPYRIGWADELGKKHDVTFVYVKETDAERNDSWLVRTSTYAKMVKLPSVIIKNHAITFSIIKYLKEHKSDIIIFDGYGTIPNFIGIISLSLSRKSYFINMDGVRIGHGELFATKILKKIVFNSYSYFLCGSEYSKNYIMSYGIKEEKICVHNFTSLYQKDIIKEKPTEQERSDARAKLNLKDVPTVIAVGRFLKLKQFDLLIEAFEKFDKSNQLLLIGEGEEKATYEKLISKMNMKNVYIIDFQTFSMLKNYYLAADVLVLPSKSEVWGLVINEAMGCAALPVIASDRCVAGYSLIRPGENGFIFPYESKETLCKYMGEILDDKCLRDRMQEKSLEIVREYTIELLANRHLQFFDIMRNMR